MNEDMNTGFRLRNSTITISNIQELLNARITDKSRTVFLAIASNLNEAGHCYLTLEEIGACCPRYVSSKDDMAPMGKSGVSRCLKELENTSLIRRSGRALVLCSSDLLLNEQPNKPIRRGIPDLPQNSVKGEGFVMLLNEQQNHGIKPKNGDLFDMVSGPKKKLPDEQQKGPKKARKDDRLLNEQQSVPVKDINNIYINNNINNNKTNTTTTAKVKNARTTKEDIYSIDDFTKQHYPGSPVPVRFAELYFQSYQERHGLQVFDFRAAALHFMDHWEHEKQWLYKRKKDSFPTKIDSSRVKSHLQTWASNMKRSMKQGRNPYPIEEPVEEKPSGKKKVVHPWLNYDQLLKHAQMNGVQNKTNWMSSQYETNGEKGKTCRWRYVGMMDVKYTFGKVKISHVI